MLAKEKVTEDRWSTVEENELTAMLKTHSGNTSRLRVHNCEKGLTRRRTTQSIRECWDKERLPWESTEQVEHGYWAEHQPECQPHSILKIRNSSSWSSSILTFHQTFYVHFILGKYKLYYTLTLGICYDSQPCVGVVYFFFLLWIEYCPQVTKEIIFGASEMIQTLKRQGL